MTRSRTILLIGICGGSGSGKTTFAQCLRKNLGDDSCAILSQDHYYIDQSARFTGDGENVNFDHPDALDFPLFQRHLISLKNGEEIQVPIYDFPSHKRLLETHSLQPKPFVLVDGTLILAKGGIRSCFDFTFFIDTPEELRFERRLRRDVTERGRTEEGVTRQFLRQVKPMHDLYVEPSQFFATRKIPGTAPFEENMGKWVDLLRDCQPKEL